jgi:hypothetical protein
MFSSLPENPLDFLDWSWPQIEPFYQNLLDRTLVISDLNAWLADWTRLKDLVDEAYARRKVAIDRDTRDTQAETRYHAFLDIIHPAAQAADPQRKEQLVASGGAKTSQRRCPRALKLLDAGEPAALSEERKLAGQYDKLLCQTVLGRKSGRSRLCARYYTDRSCANA